MITSDKGIKFIGDEEGLILHPYLDSVKKATIGIGSTYYADGTPVKITDKAITKEQALELFRKTLVRYEAQVNKSVTSVINQNQFDALVSLCYNIGTGGFSSSTLVKHVNINPSDKGITDLFCLWKNAGGKPILLGRRKREAQLYFS